MTDAIRDQIADEAFAAERGLDIVAIHLEHETGSDALLTRDHRQDRQARRRLTGARQLAKVIGGSSEGNRSAPQRRLRLKARTGQQWRRSEHLRSEQ